MYYCNFLLTVITVIIYFIEVGGVELTFELQANEKQCFYENLFPNSSVTLQFQVVSGGQYDVDMILEAPSREIIYKQIRAQFDVHTFIPKLPGVYSVCFSNEFSTFSHKIVFMNFKVGEQESPQGIGEHIKLMTQMESSAQEIYKHLSTIHDYQTYHRLKEAKGRNQAEELNAQVLWWSVLEIIMILLSNIGQVFIVIRDFCNNKTIIPLNKT